MAGLPPDLQEAVRQWTTLDSDFDFGFGEDEQGFSWDPAAPSGEAEAAGEPRGATEGDRWDSEFAIVADREPWDALASRPQGVRAGAEGQGIGGRGAREEAEGEAGRREVQRGQGGSGARGREETNGRGRSGAGAWASGGVPLDGSGLECVAGAGAAVLLRGQPGEQFSAHHWRTLQR